jgi:hypothetical protein
MISLFELHPCSNLFPTAGFQIIIERSSPEDPPYLGRAIQQTRKSSPEAHLLASNKIRSRLSAFRRNRPNRSQPLSASLAQSAVTKELATLLKAGK